jgi:DNA-binding MarR family transcriptional regulator
MTFDPSLPWNNMFNGGLGFLLTQARNAFLVDMERELAPLSTSIAEFMVVLGIAHRRALTLGEFSDYLGYDGSATKRLLDKMEEKGVIRRVRCSHDRRTWSLRLTDGGLELYPKIMACVSAVHARSLEAFSEADVERFQRYLRKMVVPGALAVEVDAEADRPQHLDMVVDLGLDNA